VSCWPNFEEHARNDLVKITCELKRLVLCRQQLEEADCLFSGAICLIMLFLEQVLVLLFF
jgi:hypothetical protein